MVSGDGVVETEKGLDLVQLLPGGSDQLITVCNKNLKQRKKIAGTFFENTLIVSVDG